MNQHEELRDIRDKMKKLGLSTNLALQQLLIAEHVQQLRQHQSHTEEHPLHEDNNTTEDAGAGILATVSKRFHTASRSVSPHRRRPSLWGARTKIRDGGAALSRVAIGEQDILTSRHKTTHSPTPHSKRINSQSKSLTSPPSLQSRRRRSLWAASTVDDEENILNASFRRRSTAKARSVSMDLSMKSFVPWNSSAVPCKKQQCQDLVMHADKRDDDVRQTIEEFYFLSDSNPAPNHQQRLSILERRFSGATHSESKQYSNQASRWPQRRSFSMDHADFLADLPEVEGIISHDIHCEEVPTSFVAKAEEISFISEEGMSHTVQQPLSKDQRRVPVSLSSRPKMRRSFSMDDADFFLGALLEESSRETNLDLETSVADGIEDAGYSIADTISATAENDCLDPPAEMDSPTAFDAPSRRPKCILDTKKSKRRSHQRSISPFTTSQSALSRTELRRNTGS